MLIRDVFYHDVFYHAKEQQVKNDKTIKEKLNGLTFKYSLKKGICLKRVVQKFSASYMISREDALYSNACSRCLYFSSAFCCSESPFSCCVKLNDVENCFVTF